MRTILLALLLPQFVRLDPECFVELDGEASLVHGLLGDSGSQPAGVHALALGPLSNARSCKEECAAHISCRAFTWLSANASRTLARELDPRSKAAPKSNAARLGVGSTCWGVINNTSSTLARLPCAGAFSAERIACAQPTAASPSEPGLDEDDSFYISSTTNGIGAIFFGVLLSLGQTAVLVASGLYLGRSGIVDAAGAKALSAIGMNLLIPALLFVRVFDAATVELLASAWVALVLPFIFVPCGVLLGYLCVLITRPGPHFERGMVAAVAFGNSTGLPIIILSVINDALMAPEVRALIAHKTSARSQLMPPTDPLVYLSIYSLTYPILQWSVGKALLEGDAYCAGAPGAGPDNPLSPRREQPQSTAEQERPEGPGACCRLGAATAATAAAGVPSAGAVPAESCGVEMAAAAELRSIAVQLGPLEPLSPVLSASSTASCLDELGAPDSANGAMAAAPLQMAGAGASADTARGAGGSAQRASERPTRSLVRSFSHPTQLLGSDSDAEVQAALQNARGLRRLKSSSGFVSESYQARLQLLGNRRHSASPTVQNRVRFAIASSASCLNAVADGEAGVVAPELQKVEVEVTDPVTGDSTIEQICYYEEGEGRYSHGGRQPFLRARPSSSPDPWSALRTLLLEPRPTEDGDEPGALGRAIGSPNGSARVSTERSLFPLSSLLTPSHRGLFPREQQWHQLVAAGHDDRDAAECAGSRLSCSLSAAAASAAASGGPVDPASLGPAGASLVPRENSHRASLDRAGPDLADARGDSRSKATPQPAGSGAGAELLVHSPEDLTPQVSSPREPMLGSLLSRTSSAKHRSSSYVSWRSAARKWARGARQILSFLTEKVLVPPVRATLLGIVLGLIPWTRALLAMKADAAAKTGRPPLEFVYSGISKLGAAAVPINLITLGLSLAKGPDFTAVSHASCAAIVVAKLLLMPLLSMAMIALLSRSTVRFIDIQEPYDQCFFLMMFVVCATPTANNVLVMCTISGQDRAAMSTVIFVQYVASPVILTLTICGFIATLVDVL